MRYVILLKVQRSIILKSFLAQYQLQTTAKSAEARSVATVSKHLTLLRLCKQITQFVRRERIGCRIIPAAIAMWRTVWSYNCVNFFGTEA